MENVAAWYMSEFYASFAPTSFYIKSCDMVYEPQKPHNQMKNTLSV